MAGERRNKNTFPNCFCLSCKYFSPDFSENMNFSKRASFLEQGTAQIFQHTSDFPHRSLQGKLFLKTTFLQNPNGSYGDRRQNASSEINPVREFVCSVTRWILSQGLTSLLLFLFPSLAQMYMHRCAFHYPVPLAGERDTDVQTLPPKPSCVQPFFFVTTHIWKTKQKEMVG